MLAEGQGLILKPKQIEAIDEASLKILEEAGIFLDDEGMRTTLASQGCRVEGRRVWLPRGFVEERLQQAPSTFTLYSRDGSQALTIGGEGRIAANSGVVPYIYDLETGELRHSTIQDVRDATRILDALPRVGVVYATLVEPTDVPPAMTILKGFEAAVRNTTKPIIGPGLANGAEARWTVAMGVAIRGSERALAEQPFFAPFLCPVSPLTYHAPLIAAIRVCAQVGLPLAFVTNPVTGLTAPLTLAGALAQMHAELLAAIVLAQQMQPGLPVLYEGSMGIADLHTLVAFKGWPESGLTEQSIALLGRYRGLPTTSFGLTSVSKMVDAEYGYEKAADGLASALAKPHILSGMGCFGGGVYASYESLIVDHEIVGFLWRLLDGLRVDEETLGVEVVREAMEGADFISHGHTLAHLRSGEYWTPTLSDSLGLDEWLAQGRPGALSRARERARDILTSHTVPSLPLDADSRLQKVMMEAERALLKEKPSQSPIERDL